MPLTYCTAQTWRRPGGEHARAAVATRADHQRDLAEHAGQHLGVDLGERQQREVDDVVFRRPAGTSTSGPAAPPAGTAHSSRPAASAAGCRSWSRGSSARRLQDRLRHRADLDALARRAVGRAGLEPPHARQHRLDDAPERGRRRRPWPTRRPRRGCRRSRPCRSRRGRAEAERASAARRARSMRRSRSASTCVHDLARGGRELVGGQSPVAPGAPARWACRSGAAGRRRGCGGRLAGDLRVPDEYVFGHAFPPMSDRALHQQARAGGRRPARTPASRACAPPARQACPSRT